MTPGICVVGKQVLSGDDGLEGIRRLVYDERRRIVEKLWHNSAGELQYMQEGATPSATQMTSGLGQNFGAMVQVYQLFRG